MKVKEERTHLTFQRSQLSRRCANLNKDDPNFLCIWIFVFSQYRNMFLWEIFNGALLFPALLHDVEGLSYNRMSNYTGREFIVYSLSFWWPLMKLAIPCCHKWTGSGNVRMILSYWINFNPYIDNEWLQSRIIIGLDDIYSWKDAYITIFNSMYKFSKGIKVYSHAHKNTYWRPDASAETFITSLSPNAMFCSSINFSVHLEQGGQSRAHMVHLLSIFIQTRLICNLFYQYEILNDLYQFVTKVNTIFFSLFFFFLYSL